MQSIISPWASRFDEFVGSIRETALIAAPYITREPLERLAHRLKSRRQSIRLDLLTNLSPSSLIDRSLDGAAIAWLCESVPGTTVRHLRSLHAKAYVADAHTAIVTSANLTNGGLHRNAELGVAITDVQAVRQIARDLREYGNLGVLVPPHEIAQLGDIAVHARNIRDARDRAIPTPTKQQFADVTQKIEQKLIYLRTAGDEFAADPKASITGQFADAVKYVLRVHGPLPTSELSPLVRALKPELCDDDVDRVIHGVSYGRRWKHDIRNAQQQLKRNGVIVLEHRKWRLAQQEQPV